MAAPPALRVADVFRAHWAEYLREHSVPVFQQKTIRHLLACRTPALGGHVWRCPSCGHEAVLYNSCRDRHCPTCQGSARQKWLDQRMQEVIPVPYFHVVFTLPHAIHPLLRHNRKKLLDLFFREVNATLQEFALDPQWRLEGQLGYLAVLHTWSQLLREHIHLHCAVPGGVWQKDLGAWVCASRNWLFREESLAERFRNRFLQALARRLKKGQLVLPEGATDWLNVCSRLSRKRWIVYAKQPFAGPQQVLEYLGRYTHKVAISDYRILAMEDGQVTFRYRDRKAGDIEKQITLSAEVFIRRFLLHILPPGLQKIRFYGWMARNVRTENLRRIRQVLDVPPPPLPQRVQRPNDPICPQCGKDRLRLCRVEQARAPPMAA
jgi:hypothetical protein